MANYLITGTSKGIGLELVRQLSEKPTSEVSHIFAVTRNKNSSELNDLISKSNGRIINIVTEITDASKLGQAVKEVETALGGEGGLDVLINNAGVGGFSQGGIKAWSAADLLDTFHTNAVAPHLTTAAFFPLLERGREKKIINVTSTLGSIGMAEHFQMAPTHAYKTSKAALNMLTKLYALEHADQGFTFLLISPGYTKTTFPGGEYGDLEVDTSVKAVLEIVTKADTAMNGKFFNINVPGWEDKEPKNRYDGSEVEW